MKVRSGFVSNSSSSSFIIALKQKPTSAEELHSWMFPDGPTSVNLYGDHDVPSAQIAQQAFEDIVAAEPLSLEQLRDEIESGQFEGRPNYPTDTWDLPAEKRDKAWRHYEKDCEEAALRLANKFSVKNSGDLFFSVSYSDNDGSFQTTMEHGDVFGALPHLRISHH